MKALPIDQLRQRSSTKWRTHDADVLPLFVAETDFPLAPAISAVLARAVELGDTGYTPPQPGIREAYTAFAQRRFGWTVDPDRIRTTCDVMMGVVEVLRQVIKPGDRVITNPPVYPPFDMCIVEAGGVVDRVPLIETGTVHSRESLAALAEIAERFGATVVSDEIHSPSTQPGVTFTPFISASDAAARVGYVITSASKAFNLAGLKCALIITASDGPTQIVADLPPEVEWRTGLFGALAAVAAFAPESDEWLDSLLAALDENRRLLGELLEEHLPGARYRMPDAGFLAWVDLSALGWGDDPAERILTEAKVAFNQGPNFGPEGNGHVRINFGCSPEVLREAVERAGALLAK